MLSFSVIADGQMGFHINGASILLVWPLDCHLHPGMFGWFLFGPLYVSWRHNTWRLCLPHNFTMRSRLGEERPSTFADMIVSRRHRSSCRAEVRSWYMLLVDGGSRICNQISYSQRHDVDASAMK